MPRLLLLTLLLPGPARPESAPPEPLSAAEAARRDALARYGVGRLRSRNDLPVQAVKQFEAAARADPTSPEPLKPLVKLYAEVGRDRAAVRAAEKVLELDPDDADTAHALGKLLYDAGQYPRAAEALWRAADSPRVANRPARRLGILRDLARVCAAAADWAGAEAALRAADKLLTDRRDALVKSAPYPSPADLDRDLAAVREKLGEALAGQRKSAEAEAAFRSAHELSVKIGDKASAARLDWHLSGLLAAAGKADAALAHLEKFLALKPSGPVPYDRLADLLRRAGRGDAVPTTLARLAAENPANESIRWVLATELGKDDPAAAARLFREQEGRTADPEFFRRLVRFDKDTGRLADLLAAADRLFRAARPPEPADPAADPPPADPAAVDRARAFADAVKAEPGLTTPLVRQALADARGGVSRARDTSELVVALAERDGQLAAAEELLRAAVQAGDREAEVRLLEVLAKQRKWTAVKTEAAGIIAQATRPRRGQQVQERSLAPEWYAARAHAELGEAAQALATAEEGLVRQAKNRAWARRQKAFVLNLLGRHKEAVAECLDIIAEFPAPADVRPTRYVLSDAYLGLKEYAKAEAELRAILDDDPDDAQALNNLGYNLADQGRKLPEAEALIRRAIEADRFERTKAGNPEPESGIYLDSLGWVLFRRGKLAEARDALEQASRLPDSATDGVVWDHLGDVCFRLGDKDAARRAWEKAAELLTDSHAGRQQNRLQEVRRKLRQAP